MRGRLTPLRILVRDLSPVGARWAAAAAAAAATAAPAAAAAAAAAAAVALGATALHKYITHSMRPRVHGESII